MEKDIQDDLINNLNIKTLFKDFHLILPINYLANLIAIKYSKNKNNLQFNILSDKPTYYSYLYDLKNNDDIIFNLPINNENSTGNSIQFLNNDTNILEKNMLKIKYMNYFFFLPRVLSHLFTNKYKIRNIGENKLFLYYYVTNFLNYMCFIIIFLKILRITSNILFY